MKAISRSRRLRLSRRKQLLTQPVANDNDDSDIEHDVLEKTSIVQSNKNANRIPTVLFDIIPSLSIEEKHPKTNRTSSDQASLSLYSMNSQPKSTTATTPLTDLTSSNTNQTDITTVKTDLTQLSGVETLDSLSINTDHVQSLSLDRNISLSNISNRIQSTKDLTQIYDTDTSIRSIVFSKDNLSTQEHSYPMYQSYFTLPHIGNEDRVMAIASSSMNANINICQRSPVKWISTNMTTRLKILISCSSLSLIIGIIVLVIIL